ncbi:MAG: RNA polymerase sigma factor [Ilumatobacteraceae bacterium]
MDRSAEFESLFRREHPRLVALGLGLTGDREVARELAQEALLRAYIDWSKVRGYSAPAAWLRRVVINQAVDVHRRQVVERRTLQRVHSSDVVVDSSGDPASSWWWRAVRELPERQRIAVALFYVDEYSIAEIAEVMGVRQGTVKASLSHARAALAAALARKEEL